MSLIESIFLQRSYLSILDSVIKTFSTYLPAMPALSFNISNILLSMYSVKLVSLLIHGPIPCYFILLLCCFLNLQYIAILAHMNRPYNFLYSKFLNIILNIESGILQDLSHFTSQSSLFMLSNYKTIWVF